MYDATRIGFSRILFVIRPELESDFRDHAWLRYGESVRCQFVHQELTDLPDERQPPPGRDRPWGTGHAVWVAREVVQESFAVCNADDFYGYGPIERVARHLRDSATVGSPSYAMVGYALRKTLADSGGVSRGIGRIGDDGYLGSLFEVLDIRAGEGGITGVSPGGDPHVLTGEELASRNLWGFNPRIFPLLEGGLLRFLAGLHEISEEPRQKAEFRLSSFVGEMVAARRIRVRVIPASEPTFGLTHRADLSETQRCLRLLVAEGFYPLDLSTAFRRLRKI